MSFLFGRVEINKGYLYLQFGIAHAQHGFKTCLFQRMGVGVVAIANSKPKTVPLHKTNLDAIDSAGGGGGGSILSMHTGE